MITPSNDTGLSAAGAWYAYGSRPAVRDVSLTVPPGAMLALAGPNGSGKSTLLRLLSGARRPDRGEVTLDGILLRDLTPKARARRIAVVPQHVNPALTFRVDALVAMGRTPHAGFLGTRDLADRRAIEAALAMTDSIDLADRRFNELSGGEQQRVALAVALAQETQFLLLDEPTVHLDLHHQHELLELLRRLHASRGITILAAMHDLNLASLFFDTLAVLDNGALAALGPARDVLARPDVLSVFRAPLAVIPHPQTGAPQILLERSP